MKRRWQGKRIRIVLSPERKRLRQLERSTDLHWFSRDRDLADWVAKSRAACGLPPTVEDDETIAAIVDELRPPSAGWSPPQASASES